MSDANKCDRCGAFYEPYKEKSYYIMKRNFGGCVDLCPVCNDSLESWLTLRPKEAADGPKQTEE